MTVELNVFGVRMFKVAFHKREREMLTGNILGMLQSHPLLG